VGAGEIKTDVRFCENLIYIESYKPAGCGTANIRNMLDFDYGNRVLGLILFNSSQMLMLRILGMTVTYTT
jgi:hypothetical protein